jgi:hypothetical protein
MTDFGLFQDDDVTAACCESTSSRQPEQSGPDDRGIAYWCHVA